MREPGRQDVDMQPVVGGRSRRGAWLAAGLVAAVLVAVVALGRFGPQVAGGPGPPRTAAPAAAAPATLTAASATPGPTITVAPGRSEAVGEATASRPTAAARVFVARGMGYQVRRSDTTPEAIAESFDDRTVLFAYTRLGIASRGGGSIEVAVGTPGQGSAVPGPVRTQHAYGATLGSLLASYRNLAGVLSGALAPYPVGGEPGSLMDVTLAFTLGQRAVAMTVHGGRAYIMSADGFETGVPATGRAARHRALREFLDRFAFLGPPLYISPDLQFEAPLITERQPAGITIAFGSERYGHLTFDDGTATTSIRVDVGTSAHPVRPPVARGVAPVSASLWAADIGELTARFLSAFESGFATPTRVGGEPAMRIDRPGDIGAAVLVVYAGRAYVITTTGASGPDVSPWFDEFLRGWQFLDDVVP